MFYVAQSGAFAYVRATPLGSHRLPDRGPQPFDLLGYADRQTAICRSGQHDSMGRM